MRNWKLKTAEKGFTLPELLVAIFVFSLILGAAGNLFISGIASQRRSLAAQDLLDQVSYVVEYMSRALRQAQKETGQGNCLAAGANYEVTRGGKGIRFVNLSDQCQEFFLDPDTATLKEAVDQVASPLTSNNIRVTLAEFAIIGASQDDMLQPRVSFVFEAATNEEKQSAQMQTRLQTTVSQRNPDVAQ